MKFKYIIFLLLITCSVQCTAHEKKQPKSVVAYVDTLEDLPKPNYYFFEYEEYVATVGVVAAAALMVYRGRALIKKIMAEKEDDMSA